MSRERSAQSHKPASRSRRAWLILSLTALIGLFIDLWSKWYAFQHVVGFPVTIERRDVLSVPDLGMLIPHHEPVTILPGILEFTLVLNPGAVFGIGAGQRWFFVVFTVIACIVAVTLFVRWTRAQDWLAHSGFGLIIAGGLGNLYDRLIFACVRDFIHPLPGVQLPFGIKWPGGSTEVWPYVSNVADAFLIAGIVFLMIHAWRMPEPQPHSDTETPRDPSNTSPPGSP